MKKNLKNTTPGRKLKTKQNKKSVRIYLVLLKFKNDLYFS